MDIDSACSSRVLVDVRLADVFLFHAATSCMSAPQSEADAWGLRSATGCLDDDFKIKGECINRSRHMVHPVTDSSLRNSTY